MSARPGDERQEPGDPGVRCPACGAPALLTGA